MEKPQGVSLCNNFLCKKNAIDTLPKPCIMNSGMYLMCPESEEKPF